MFAIDAQFYSLGFSVHLDERLSFFRVVVRLAENCWVCHLQKSRSFNAEHLYLWILWTISPGSHGLGSWRSQRSVGAIYIISPLLPHHRVKEAGSEGVDERERCVPSLPVRFLGSQVVALVEHVLRSIDDPLCTFHDVSRRGERSMKSRMICGIFEEW